MEAMVTTRKQAAMIAWSFVAVCLIAVVIVAVIVRSNQRSDYNHRVAVSQAQTHFYSVIAGKAQPGTGVADSLAMDLRSVPVAKLRFFQGTSNKYGGVASEIGIDPFDNSCGVECGSLRPSVLANVTEARRYGYFQEPSVRKHLTSLALPTVALLVWLLIGAAGALAAPFRKRQTHEALRRQYPDECRTLDRLNAAIGALPPGRQRDELARMREGIEHGLLVRVDPSTPDDQVTEARLDKLMQEAQFTLQSVEAGNKALES